MNSQDMETMKTTAQREVARPTTNADVQRQEFIAPEVNIYQTRDGYMLEAEMPGVSKDGLEIMLEGNELTIVGHRRNESPCGDRLVSECRSASFKRVFELDPAIDTAKISAKVEQGILTLTLPKSEQVKPRRITVD